MSRRRQPKGDPATLDLEGAVKLTQKPKRTEPLEAQTDNQARYIQHINANTLTFGTGPAGTGKTYIAAAMAADALKAGKTRKIILTRPAQEAGEKLGYLPGELSEKYEPYLRPFYDILKQRLGQGYLDCAIKNGKIEPIPVGYMRGMTFDNCWVLFDEAQNSTPVQMKMFLTRIGKWCKVIVNGDLSQKDIAGESGLLDGISIAADLSEVGVVEFNRDDVVRSGLVQEIIDQYSQRGMEGVARFMKTAEAPFSR